MHLATITLFELGQFLRIVLWIALPMVMLSLLVTVYIHYSRKTSRGDGKDQSLPAPVEEPLSGELASAEGHSATAKEPFTEKPFGEKVFSAEPEKLSPETARDLEVVGETVYQGLLWMKNKYEQDREQSTAKYMQLKEEYGQLKEKYQELETRHAYTQELLNEGQSTIDRLRGQLHQETLRTAEAKRKLESSGHLLMKIHKELDEVLAREAMSSETSAETGSAPEANPEWEAPLGIIPDEAERSAPERAIRAEGVVYAQDPVGPETPHYNGSADPSDIPVEHSETTAHPENPIAEGNRITAWVESEAIA